MPKGRKIKLEEKELGEMELGKRIEWGIGKRQGALPLPLPSHYRVVTITDYMLPLPLPPD
jgi:hypothetical protein